MPVAELELPERVPHFTCFGEFEIFNLNAWQCFYSAGTYFGLRNLCQEINRLKVHYSQPQLNANLTVENCTLKILP